MKWWTLERQSAQKLTVQLSTRSATLLDGPVYTRCLDKSSRLILNHDVYNAMTTCNETFFEPDAGPCDASYTIFLPWDEINLWPTEADLTLDNYHDTGSIARIRCPSEQLCECCQVMTNCHYWCGSSMFRSLYGLSSHHLLIICAWKVKGAVSDWGRWLSLSTKTLQPMSGAWCFDCLCWMSFKQMNNRHMNTITPQPALNEFDPPDSALPAYKYFNCWGQTFGLLFHRSYLNPSI